LISDFPFSQKKLYPEQSFSTHGTVATWLSPFLDPKRKSRDWDNFLTGDLAGVVKLFTFDFRLFAAGELNI